MFSISTDNHRWAVVLAGGDGARLQEFVQQVTGSVRPKQFCELFGRKTLLGHTRERIAPLFGHNRTLFALTRAHEPYYVSEVADVSDRRRIVQPANRGTAVAMALCLQSIVRRDADALVAFFPADHHYLNIDAFQSTVDWGLQEVEQYPHSVLMVGARATYPEVEYGWIEPGRTLHDAAPGCVSRVSRFWEKPDAHQAATLMKRGCLWNTFVTMGRATAFMELLHAAAPQFMKLVTDAKEHRMLDQLYAGIPAIDFSRDVLAALPRRLLVLEDSASGWTDLGNPRRVTEIMRIHGYTPARLLPNGDSDQFLAKVSRQR